MDVCDAIEQGNCATKPTGMLTSRVLRAGRRMGEWHARKNIYGFVIERIEFLLRQQLIMYHNKSAAVLTTQDPNPSAYRGEHLETKGSPRLYREMTHADI